MHDEWQYLPSASSVPLKKSLSVCIDDARISHVSREKLQNMWDKAEELLNIEELVLPAAGATKSARQVASLSAFKSGKCEVRSS